jgi:hypothetical protein
VALTKGKHIHLKYRIIHLPGEILVDNLDKEYNKYLHWLKKQDHARNKP